MMYVEKSASGIFSTDAYLPFLPKPDISMYKQPILLHSWIHCLRHGALVSPTSPFFDTTSITNIHSYGRLSSGARLLFAAWYRLGWQFLRTVYRLFRLYDCSCSPVIWRSRDDYLDKSNSPPPFFFAASRSFLPRNTSKGRCRAGPWLLPLLLLLQHSSVTSEYTVFCSVIFDACHYGEVVARTLAPCWLPLVSDAVMLAALEHRCGAGNARQAKVTDWQTISSQAELFLCCDNNRRCQPARVLTNTCVHERVAPPPAAAHTAAQFVSSSDCALLRDRRFVEVSGYNRVLM